MKFEISTELACCPSTIVDIPAIEKWSDIKEWYVKWDTLHYTLDNITRLELELDMDMIGSIDTKRPVLTRIRNVYTGGIIAED